MTVRRLEEELGPGELQEWSAYMRIDAFIHERDMRDDYRAAQAPLIFAATNRGRGGKDPVLGDFVCDWYGRGKPREDGNVVAAKVRAYLGNVKAAQDRKKARDG